MKNGHIKLFERTFSKTKGGHWVKFIFNHSENIINFLVYNPKMINSLYHKYCFSQIKTFHSCLYRDKTGCLNVICRRINQVINVPQNDAR